MTKMSLLFVVLFVVLLGAGQCMFGQDLIFSTVNCVRSAVDDRGNACSDSDCFDGCRSGGAVVRQASKAIPHTTLGKLGRQRSSFAYHPSFPRTSVIRTGGTLGRPERADNLTIKKPSFSQSPPAKLSSLGRQPQHLGEKLNPIVLNFCTEPFNPNSTMCSTEYMDETLGNNVFSLDHRAYQEQSDKNGMAGSRS